MKAGEALFKQQGGPNCFASKSQHFPNIRVSRRALANSAKHAGGAAIRVALEHRDGQLEFVVADAGPGFDPGTPRRGMGLQNMADRMEALGGRVEVRSSPGEGTTILGRIPEPALELVG